MVVVAEFRVGERPEGPASSGRWSAGERLAVERVVKEVDGHLRATLAALVSRWLSSRRKS